MITRPVDTDEDSSGRRRAGQARSRTLLLQSLRKTEQSQQSQESSTQRGRPRPSEPWIVPPKYLLPRKVVAGCLEEMDVLESPEMPGMLHKATLEKMVHRFDKIFGSHGNKEREAEIQAAMDHLARHTKRRRGESVVSAGLLEWEHSAKVFSLFSVQLNVFERILFTLDYTVCPTIGSRVISAVMVLAIFLSIISWMVSTLPHMKHVPESCDASADLRIGECPPRPLPVFKAIEGPCVYLFTFEYLLRLLVVQRVRFEMLDDNFVVAILKGTVNTTPSESCLSKAFGCPSKARNELEGGLTRTLKHFIGITNLIDLMAILPYWIESSRAQADSQGGGLVALRMLRITRIFRVFKLGRYSDAFMLFTRVMEQSSPALLLMTFFIMLGCGLFGTLIWFAEGGDWYPPGHPMLAELTPPITNRGAYLRFVGTSWTAPSKRETDASDLEETPFQSIVHSFWFVIVTVTTVGFGDVSPTSLAGKLVGALMILTGVIVLAMPIGVVGANFSREYYRVIDEKKKRVLIQQHFETLAAVEAEQDALADEEKSREEAEADVLQPCNGQHDDLRSSEEAILTEKSKQSRRQLIMAAEVIDKSWYDFFHPKQYTSLSHDLRRFLAYLFPDATDKDMGGVGQHAMRIVVSTEVLADLDVLTSKLHDIIHSNMSCEDLADFSLKQARQCRWEWAVFVDECWQCVLEGCHIEKPPHPPQFFEMKAMDARDHANAEVSRRKIHDIRAAARLSSNTEQESAWRLGGLDSYDIRARSKSTNNSVVSAASTVNDKPWTLRKTDGAAVGPRLTEESVENLPNCPT